jgi:hypothetical protein
LSLDHRAVQQLQVEVMLSHPENSVHPPVLLFHNAIEAIYVTVVHFVVNSQASVDEAVPCGRDGASLYALSSIRSER